MKRLKNSDSTATIVFSMMLFATTIFSIPLLSDTYISPKIPVLALTLTLLIGCLYRVKRLEWSIDAKIVFVLSALFLISTVVSGHFSGISINRLLWGETTRGNGLISYFLLVLVFLTTSKFFYLVNVKLFSRLIVFFIFISASYFFLQYVGLNLYSESFVYGPMVGFFGNPNFTSSFLGMSFAFVLGLIIFQSTSRYPLLILAIGILPAIYLSGSIQGLLLVFFSIAVYSHLYGFHRGIEKPKLLISSIFTLVASSFIFIGFLGLGPLGDYLERRSLRTRFGYFESALLMFRSNPLTGVGTDSYGDHFRQFRPDWLTKLIGDATTSNDAHNVYLNILATSGGITFLLFLALNLLVVFRGVAAVLRGSRDLTLIVSLVVLLNFQLQSLISINQIGLSIWGWFAMGVVFSRTQPQLLKKKSSKEVRTASLALMMTLVVGLTSSVTILGSQRVFESLKLKSAVSGIVIDADQSYREAKFLEIANSSDYWLTDVTNSMLIQEAFLNLGASEAAETISEATYLKNQDSRDALWALTAIKTRREKIDEAIVLREKLILKENMSSWVLLDQAEAFIKVKNKEKSRYYLDLASAKKDVDQVRITDLEQKWLSIG
jgi:O-antigen ligase